MSPASRKEKGNIFKEWRKESGKNQKYFWEREEKKNELDKCVSEEAKTQCYIVCHSEDGSHWPLIRKMLTQTQTYLYMNEYRYIQKKHILTCMKIHTFMCFIKYTRKYATKQKDTYKCTNGNYLPFLLHQKINTSHENEYRNTSTLFIFLILWKPIHYW